MGEEGEILGRRPCAGAARKHDTQTQSTRRKKKKKKKKEKEEKEKRKKKKKNDCGRCSPAGPLHTGRWSERGAGP
jgi:hypothetical protein